MSNLVPLNRHQKKALVIELYKHGKTRRQIAEIVHMSFKDIADVINEYILGKISKSTNQRNRKMLRLLSYFCKANNLLN